MAQDCLTIDCVTVDCIEIPDDDGCVDGTPLTTVVSGLCVNNPQVIINDGLGLDCQPGAVNTLLLTGCCGLVTWEGITAVGHSGVGTVADSTSNPTTFTVTQPGDYLVLYCCDPE